MTSTLTRTDFPEFFREVTGHFPFAWQLRLLDFILDHGRWPDEIAAPTGTGKSAVIEIHAFANAVSTNIGVRVPRRLSIIVPRRAIVDSHFLRARHLHDHLQEADGDTVSGAVCRALLALGRPLYGEDGGSQSPIQTVLLRGAVPADRAWVDDVLSCSIICATPAMFASRLLWRGYGSTRYARPREAGMLAYDTVAVLDEAHLMRQLEITVRRVPQLEAMALEVPDLPALQVVGSTATPGANRAGGGETYCSVGVVDGDFSDEVLATRLNAPKHIRIVETQSWPGRRTPSVAYVKEVCAEVLDLVDKFRGDEAASEDKRTVGCVVNNVDTAYAVARALAKDASKPVVVCRTGQSRQYDLDRSFGLQNGDELDEPLNAEQQRSSVTSDEERFGGLYTIAGNPHVDVLVSTQAIEVGIDIDLAAMVTELAPGAALAQRFGRVNRVGRSRGADVRVLAPADTSGDYAKAPYETDDLNSALDWLHMLAASPAGASAWNVALNPPSEHTPRRNVYQRLEIYDAIHLSHSSEPQFDDEDISLYFREDLDSDDEQAGVVVRDRLPADDSDALALLSAAPPQTVEVFPSRKWVAEQLTRRVLEHQPVAVNDGKSRAFVYRNGEVVQVTDPSDAAFKPGDIVIFDAAAPILDDDGRLSAQPTSCARAVPWEHLDGVVGLIAGEAVQTFGPDWTPGEVGRLVNEEIMATGDEDTVQAVFEEPEDGEAPPWILIIENTVVKNDEDDRQEASMASAAVSLHQHAQAVGSRARAVADSLGLRRSLIDALGSAGILHDDGKSASAFQMMLGRQSGEPVLAKSAARSRVERIRARERSGLPTNWRHEQLSALMASAQLRKSPDHSDNHDLVMQLVGTSHGRGRPYFPHSFETLSKGHSARAGQDSDVALLNDWAALLAAGLELFNRGEWDAAIERNRRRHGTWGTAILEALLRAADSQVSKEGS